ncbi:MAG TPA: ATP-binding protein [Methanocella sp.]|uniref:ATP-binding protein n=1 Tax=Methanocella sp. TaxID=2052833 RepID=UPI002CD04AB1|nr:ATP-binding protein [Methanocella sp.]HTY90628.1 ATP-binding protein [Methanocella sp.]
MLSRKKLSGRGLGLYLILTFLSQFYGRLHIMDRVPGDSSRGARFVVLLPAA